MQIAADILRQCWILAGPTATGKTAVGLHLAELLGAEKTLVQKSGYYSRAAAANAADRKLIRRCAIKASASRRRAARQTQRTMPLLGAVSWCSQDIRLDRCIVGCEKRVAR